MANISRLFTFLAGQPAVAGDVNAELDQLVSTLNTARVHTDGTAVMTGPLVLPGTDPTLPNQAARKAYLDAQVAAHALTPHGGGGGGAAPTVVRKTADESVASSTVLQNDDHLLFACDANSVYAVEIRLFYLSSAVSLKYGFLAPAGTTYNGTVQFINQGNVGNGSTAALSQCRFNQATSLPSGPITVADPSFNWVDIAMFLVTSATAGTFNFQFAQVSAHGTPTIIKANSILSHQKLV